MDAAIPVHVVDEPERAAAMLHPLRLRILQELAEPDSATGLARRLKMPRQLLNYHLRQLEAEKLVELVEEQQKRGCTERLVRAVARSYLISPATLGSLATDPKQIQDEVSSTYLLAVAAQTIREVAALRERATQADKRLATLTLQVDVRFASAKSQNAFAKELAETVARLAAKYHDDDAQGGRRFRFVASAYPAPTGEAERAATKEES